MKNCEQSKNNNNNNDNDNNNNNNKLSSNSTQGEQWIIDSRGLKARIALL